jgi:hypothetical protein
MIRAVPGRTWFLAGSAGLWLAAVGGGMGVLIQFASTPGDPGSPPSAWPADSAIPAPADRPVLLMMAHPRCPCTRASLEELARLMTRGQGRLDARVVFFAPAGADEIFWKTDLWSDASEIPGVEVVLDRDGAESRRFHAETSGQVLLYDAQGRLMFSGGITMARGHAGDNAGLDAIEALIGGEKTVRRQTPVFGCALHDWAAKVAMPEGAWKR